MFGEAREDAPRLQVEPAGVEPGSTHGRWLVRWRLVNEGHSAVTILAAWAPHGRFRSQDEPTIPIGQIAQGGALELALPVAWQDAGDIVENAFLILTVSVGERRWRLLARHRIEISRYGAPRPMCEVVTTQAVGFSETASR